jgi:hypothetical protein
MVCLAKRLETSVSSRWMESMCLAVESRELERRLAYYRAVLQALEHSADGIIQVKDILNYCSAGGKSTFYDKARRKSLRTAYAKDLDVSTTRIGQLVRAELPEQMITEAKVWTFRGYRAKFIEVIDDHHPTGPLSVTGDELIRALHSWGERYPKLAASQHALPPLCAVEDLMTLSRNTMDPRTASRLLTDTLVAGGSLNRGVDLREPRSLVMPPVQRRTSETVTKIYRAIHLIDQLQVSDADTTGASGRDTAVSLLRDVATLLSAVT